MSPACPTSPLEDRFVKAIAGGSLREAEELLAQYSAQVGRLLAELPPDKRSDLVSRLAGLFRWAISMARMERAQACTRLLELPPAPSYRGENPKPGPRLRLEA